MDVLQQPVEQPVGCGSFQTTIKIEENEHPDESIPSREKLCSSLQESTGTLNSKSAGTATESDANTLVAFVKKFRQCRLKRGFTQADVALCLAVADGHMVSQSTICRFEAMQLSLKSMQKLQPYIKKWLQQPTAPGSDPSVMEKRRKRRTTIKDSMKNVLESHFCQDKKPNAGDISALADKLDLEREVVRVWFCNRRQKEKKLSREESQ